MSDGNFDRFLAGVRTKLNWLPEQIAHRWARCYGTRLFDIAPDAKAIGDLGREVAPNLFEAELRFLMTHEWARSAEDVLWRRTKLGLGMKESDINAVRDWFANSADQLAAQ